LSSIHYGVNLNKNSYLLLSTQIASITEHVVWCATIHIEENREGIFRINIGVSRATFASLLAESSSENIDYSVLDVFLPHPDYAKQHFVCILNPSQENVEVTKKLIVEAHSIATTRLQRRTST
jgi:hypothetical protein